MPAWIRRTLIILAFVAVAGGGAFYWYLKDARLPAGKFTIDMAAIRALADGQNGPLPSEIRVERITTFHFPFAAVVTGEAFRMIDIPVMTYQVVWPDRSVIIDTAMDEAMSKTLATDFDPQAFGRMITALGKADQIVLTHEHVDHIGGLTHYADLANLQPALRLTREQVDHPEKSGDAKLPDAALKGYQPLVYDQYHALAPGVVLIKAPGHTPGSQMVYVKRADGAEVLFLGDIAWNIRSVETLHPRPRLVSQFVLGEDRENVMRQLVEIKRVSDETPGLFLVAGHDGAVIQKLVDSNVLIRGFMP